MNKGYLLTTVVVFLVAVAILAGVVTAYISNTVNLRVDKEKMLMASQASMDGLQMGTSYLAHFASSIGGFSLDFTGPAATSFSSVPWLQKTGSNNYFQSIYSSVDGKAWKTAFSSIATDLDVLWLNKIPAVESFFESLQASGTIDSIPDVILIQTYAGNKTDNIYRYLIVSHAIVGGKDAYSSGFAMANFLNKYVYFTDKEPPYAKPFNNVTFMNGDTVDGPARTNGTLVTLGQPDFKGYVQYGGLYEVPKTGSPNFESGSEQLSQEDINSMSMAKIASEYSAQINSEIGLPSDIKTAGETSTPIGLDLSEVYQNLLNEYNSDNYGFSYKNWNNYQWNKNGTYTLNDLSGMFENDFANWLGHYDLNSLPTEIQNDYENVISAIQGIPAMKVTFSPGNGGNSGPSMNVDYGIDTTNAINAIEHLRTDMEMFENYIGNLSSHYSFSNVTDVLGGYGSPQWTNLFSVNPEPSNSVPGISQVVVNGQSAADLLGLSSSKTFDFNFNGVVKSENDLVIGDPDETSVVEGKYTLYTTKTTTIEGNIVYNYANQLLGANQSVNDWKNSPMSSSTVNKIRNATGTDFLNIVSNYDVSMIDTPQYAKIMASIYAFNGTFWYPNYGYQTWNGRPGQLFEFGSTAQYEGGQLFGTYSGNSLRTGYNAYYAFDWRILGGLPSNMYGTPSSPNKSMLFGVRTVF